jgi:hypothetical protein
MHIILQLCNFEYTYNKVLFSHESNKAFLVLDYCRVTVRNSKSAGRGDYKKRLERNLFLLFSDNLADILDFFHCKICTICLHYRSK